MSIKRVIITGGFGFIGKALINKLIKNNIEVIVIEHPNSRPPREFNDIEVIRCDITNNSEINKLSFKNIDALIHLAAQSSGPRSFEIPYQDINLNIIGTLNIINLCLNNSIEKIIFASSFVVYGDNLNNNDKGIIENNYCSPKSIYANSKFYCENLLRNYAEPKGLNWNSLRMFNVYGPGQDITKTDQGVVGIFLNMLLKSKKVYVKGSLERYRDLIYIDDVINAWEKVLFSNQNNQVFNVGTGIKTSFKELIKMIAKCLNIKGLEIIELEGTPGDVMGCFADITKLKENTGYQTKFNLERGLKEMIKFYT